MAYQFKVKIFRINDYQNFEQSINEWLVQNTKDGKCVILNILQSESEGNTTISVFYNEYVKE